MKFVNDGTATPPRLAVYGNDWALQELPRRPCAVTWSFEECLDRLVEAGYDGCQAGVQQAKLVRSKGLRFCTSARVNTPADVDACAAAAADAGADCITVHAGWGMETDGDMDALAHAVIELSVRRNTPIYIETHRATMTQDVFRTCRLLERHPALLLNGDFSHYYCGQEMTYRGFHLTHDDLTPIIERVAFMHGRVSDAQCMQCDIDDPRNQPHLDNFASLWKAAIAAWLAKAEPGDILPFVPELGPPRSRYSITTVNPDRQVVELCNRWTQSLSLRQLVLDTFDGLAGDA